MLGYHLQPAGPVHPNRAEHPEEALPAGMEPSPRSQSPWCPPERRLTLAQELDYRAFPLTAQLFGQPEMGSLIAGPTGLIRSGNALILPLP